MSNGFIPPTKLESVIDFVPPLKPRIPLKDINLVGARRTIRSEPSVDPSKVNVEPSKIAVKPFEIAVKASEIAVKPSESAVEPSESTVEPSKPALVQKKGSRRYARQRPFRCIDHERNFPSRKALREHQQTHSPEIHRCEPPPSLSHIRVYVGGSSSSRVYVGSYECQPPDYDCSDFEPPPPCCSDSESVNSDLVVATAGSKNHPQKPLRNGFSSYSKKRPRSSLTLKSFVVDPSDEDLSVQQQRSFGAKKRPKIIVHRQYSTSNSHYLKTSQRRVVLVSGRSRDVIGTIMYYPNSNYIKAPKASQRVQPPHLMKNRILHQSSSTTTTTAANAKANASSGGGLSNGPQRVYISHHSDVRIRTENGLIAMGDLMVALGFNKNYYYAEAQMFRESLAIHSDPHALNCFGKAKFKGMKNVINTLDGIGIFLFSSWLFKREAAKLDKNPINKNIKIRSFSFHSEHLDPFLQAVGYNVASLRKHAELILETASRKRRGRGRALSRRYHRMKRDSTDGSNATDAAPTSLNRRAMPSYHSMSLRSTAESSAATAATCVVPGTIGGSRRGTRLKRSRSSLAPSSLAPSQHLPILARINESSGFLRASSSHFPPHNNYLPSLSKHPRLPPPHNMVPQPSTATAFSSSSRTLGSFSLSRSTSCMTLPSAYAPSNFASPMNSVSARPKLAGRFSRGYDDGARPRNPSLVRSSSPVILSSSSSYPVVRAPFMPVRTQPQSIPTTSVGSRRFQNNRTRLMPRSLHLQRDPFISPVDTPPVISSSRRSCSPPPPPPLVQPIQQTIHLNSSSSSSHSLPSASPSPAPSTLSLSSSSSSSRSSPRASASFIPPPPPLQRRESSLLDPSPTFRPLPSSEPILPSSTRPLLPQPSLSLTAQKHQFGSFAKGNSSSSSSAASILPQLLVRAKPSLRIGVQQQQNQNISVGNHNRNFPTIERSLQEIGNSSRIISSNRYH